MKTVFDFYKVLNILSLDVAAGAVVSAFFFIRVFDITLHFIELLCLGLTVWIIYTSDHLLDIRSMKGRASTVRHRFHQEHFNVIVVFLIAAIVLDIAFSFFLKKQLIQLGVLLSAVVLVYFVIQSRLKFLKEASGAILYTAGVLLPVIELNNPSISLFHSMVVFQFVLTALINLILFSWFDCRLDKQDHRSSLITLIGLKSGKKLLLGLFVFQGCITLTLMGASSSSMIWLIPFLMNVALFFVFLFGRFFSLNDRYRYTGDAVFFLPLLWLLL